MSERSIRRYKSWYRKLLRLYPKAYRIRFAEGMEQTFNDLCRERRNAGQALTGFVLCMFLETCGGIAKENTALIYKRSESLSGILLIATLIVLIPLVAMQFTDEVAWNAADFAVAWILLVGTGLVYKTAVKKDGNTLYRAATGVAVSTTLLLIWTNLAVGVIGSEENPVNLMYLGVIAVGIIGAIIARLRPLGMVRALSVMALAQAAVTVIVLTAGLAPPSAGSTWKVLMVNGLFIALFLLSALLFRRAARGGKGPPTSHLL